MTELDVLAEDLGISGRTLRRAAGRGLIRCQRTSPYKPTINGRERRYVRSHWPLLQRLVTALRTEHAVRLAVLFGSAARGEMHSASDVDLLLDLVDGAPPLAVARLGSKLERLLGRPVQIVTLTDAERSPLLLADVLHDGRVLIDRDGRWSKLSRRMARIQKAAAEQDAALEQAAWAALDQLAAAG
jgi:predicted nucleotidyltransferase